MMTMREEVFAQEVLSVPSPLGGGARRTVAVLGGLLSIACGVTVLLLHVVHGEVWPSDLDPYWRSAVVWAIAVGAPGAVLAWLRPANPIGWLVLSSGLTFGVSEVVYAWAVVALEVPSITLSFHPNVLWVGTWIWVPGYVLVPTVVLLLVPEGRLPSRGWRPVMTLQVIALALGIMGFALTPWERMDLPITWQGLTNPFGVAGAEWLLDVSLGMFALGVAASVVSLVVRMRGARALERQQLKWVLLGAILSVVLGASGFLAPGSLAQWVAAAAILPLVTGTTVAVLRYRLWDVEAFIARSAIYGMLTLLVAATYLAVMGLVGAGLGAGGAPLLALVLVALGLQPARTAVQRQVNRLLYGQRDDPYAVLAALGQRLEGAAGTEPGGEALPRVARTVADALRLPYTGVVVDGQLVSSHGQRPKAVERIPLLHRGEDVGELEIGVRRGEGRIGPGDRRLLGDLARGLAGAAHSLRLTRELLESRQAIVSAREEERRRLHCDLHDDLGPALAALVLQLETAHDLVRTDPDGAEALLRHLKGHARGTVDVARRIVTDLRPVNLDDLGLVEAVEELVARFQSSQLSVTTAMEDPGRLPAAVEVVLLRVAAEALANVARHSGASVCRVHLGVDAGWIGLEVVDNGIGIADGAPPGVGLRSMRERVTEIGGRCTVGRLAAGGTRVAATLPVAVS